MTRASWLYCPSRFSSTSERTRMVSSMSWESIFLFTVPNKPQIVLNGWPFGRTIVAIFPMYCRNMSTASSRVASPSFVMSSSILNMCPNEAGWVDRRTSLTKPQAFDSTLRASTYEFVLISSDALNTEPANLLEMANDLPSFSTENFPVWLVVGPSQAPWSYIPDINASMEKISPSVILSSLGVPGWCVILSRGSNNLRWLLGLWRDRFDLEGWSIHY